MPCLDERSFLFSPLFGRNESRQKKRSESNGAAGSSNRRAAGRTWTCQFMCFLDVRAKKLRTPNKEVILQKLGRALKKIKLSLEVDDPQ